MLQSIRTPERAELAYILPTYGQFPYARKCVESLVRYPPSCSFAVLLIDDNSPEFDSIDWNNWPECNMGIYHYDDSDGLTRSWNFGLRCAESLETQYAIAGNSDVLFTPNWFQPIKHAMDEGADLVGPVTNAPGHCPYQHISYYHTGYTPADNWSKLEAQASLLAMMPYRFIMRPINGFFMVAKTATWWSGAFDSEHVFDSKFKLVGNEDELQRRWRRMERRIGFTCNSFIFHYRSVSRPAGLRGPAGYGAYRGKRPRR